MTMAHRVTAAAPAWAWALKRGMAMEQEQESMSERPQSSPSLDFKGLKQRINSFAGLANADERMRLLDQMIAVLHGHYVFTTSKALQESTDPVSLLLQLRNEVSSNRTEPGSNWRFCRALSEVIAQFGDPHTAIEWPLEINNITGHMPFLIESWFDDAVGRERYFVSHKIDEEDAPPVRVGDELLRINGSDVSVWLEKDGQSRRRPLAPTLRPSRGNLDRITIIPLELVFLRGRQAEGLSLTFLRQDREKTIRCEYKFSDLNLISSNDPKTNPDQMPLVLPRSILFAPQVDKQKRARQERASTDGSTLQRTPQPAPVNVTIEELALEGQQPVCYVRIHALAATDRKQFADDILNCAHPRQHAGIIFDLRGCSGGSIRLAEYLLRRVAGGEIFPVTAQLRNSPGNERFCRAREDSSLRYRQWAESIRQRMAEGSFFSAAIPFSDTGDVGREVESKHRMRALTIVDRNTASAAEVFAAGFQDNNVGEIIGNHASTAGACAHGVRLSNLMMARVNELAYPFDRESNAGRIRFALARVLRSGRSAGIQIEGVGVKPDIIVPLTEVDMLERNRKLLTTAMTRLLAQAEIDSDSRSLPAEFVD